jgi:hypothetical protein
VASPFMRNWVLVWPARAVADKPRLAPPAAGDQQKSPGSALRPTGGATARISRS